MTGVLAKATAENPLPILVAVFQKYAHNIMISLFSLFKGNEIIDSVESGLSGKNSSSFLMTFCLSYALINWKFLVALFLVSEGQIWQATEKLKDTYLQDKFFGINNFWDLLILFTFHFGLPLLLTYVMIWKVPKLLTIPAFKKSIEHEKQKRIFLIQQEKEIETAKLELAQKKVATLATEKETAEIQQDIIETNPSTQWEKDYKNFRKLKFTKNFQDVLDAIYQHRGNTKDFDEYGNTIFEISTDILVYSDTNDLVNYDKENGKVELTDKGKFFARKYSSDDGKDLSINLDNIPF